MHNDDVYTWKELYFAPTKKLPLFKRTCLYTYTSIYLYIYVIYIYIYVYFI